MQQLLLFFALVAPAVAGDYLGLRATGISKEPTTWHGHRGTAVTIRFENDTKQFPETVCFMFMRGTDFGELGPMGAPVMKWKPREATVFIGKDKDRFVDSRGWIRTLFEETGKGTVIIDGC